MTGRRLQAEIQSFCRAEARAVEVRRYARFFREGYDAYGVPRHIWEKQKDVWLAAYRETLGLKGFLDLGSLLLRSGKYEEVSYAIAFLIPYRGEFTRDTFDRLGCWLDQGICNWAHTDFLCGELLGYCLRERIVGIAGMSSWRRSPSRWKRRAVPVTLLALVKQPARIPGLLRFLGPMMMDAERVVHQGLGWFLREAWKSAPAEVEPFLLRWKERAPRLIFQYATEKMPAGARARFRRTRGYRARSSRNSLTKASSC